MEIVRQPTVTLIGVTNEPLLVLYTGWKIMTDKNWDSTSAEIRGIAKNDRILKSTINKKDFEDVLKEIMESPRQGVLELVHFVFLLEGVSRAFQQQLTRHRIGFSYSIQSLRMVDPKNFADEERYHKPDGVSLIASDEMKFRAAMKTIQTMHRSLVSRGTKLEDARGILPLNIHSPITMGCTLLALKNLLGQRLCPSTQDEFLHIAVQLKTIVQEWNPILGSLLVPFCDKPKRCLVPDTNCGRWPI